MPSVSREPPNFDLTVDVAVAGAGGCGLCAAVSAAEAGAETIVIERDETPLGSTAMSTGLIPAAGHPDQAAQGIEDSPEIFFQDILRKTKGRAAHELALRLAAESAATVQWLRDRHGVPLDLVSSFLYPGHSRMRMFGTPNRTGGELEASLQAASERAEAALLSSARVDTLYVEDDRIVGLKALRADGSEERVGCRALVLATCGFGGSPTLVEQHIPEIAHAVYHGHPGNKGDAFVWGEALGAAFGDMSGYQGHGGLAAGYGVPILWPVIMEGGFQVNLEGRRFSNEAAGYSEQAAKVNAEPGRVAWTIFDDRLHALMLEFDDYRDALSAGAVVEAADVGELARRTGLPGEALQATLHEVARQVSAGATDRFGRTFAERPPLAPALRAVKVTGALFHTQGGLEVDNDARVRKAAGGVFANLFAGGGAARGISGPAADGYLAGNGLLSATTLGRLAGAAAARKARGT